MRWDPFTALLRWPRTKTRWAREPGTAVLLKELSNTVTPNNILLATSLRVPSPHILTFWGSKVRAQLEVTIQHVMDRQISSLLVYIG